MTVLLVEDDPEQLAVRAMLLEHHGFEVVTATTGKAALDLARDTGPHCTVLDLRLPTVEIGLDTLRQLRQHHPGMRIFVLTGAPRHTPPVEEAARYADAVVSKGSGRLLQQLEELRTGVRSARA